MQKQSKTWQGVVIEDRQQKTRTVEVPRSYPHPRYGKVIERRSHFHIHDAREESHKGDLVSFQECRPMAHSKHWRLVRIVQSGKSVGTIELKDVPEDVLVVPKKAPPLVPAAPTEGASA